MGQQIGLWQHNELQRTKVRNSGQNGVPRKYQVMLRTRDRDDTQASARHKIA